MKEKESITHAVYNVLYILYINKIISPYNERANGNRNTIKQIAKREVSKMREIERDSESIHPCE